MNCPWDLVAVWWRDAYDGESGWTTVASYRPVDQTVVTVGFLWPNCLEGHVTLVSSYMPDEPPGLM